MIENLREDSKVTKYILSGIGFVAAILAIYLFGQAMGYVLWLISP